MQRRAGLKYPATPNALALCRNRWRSFPALHIELILHHSPLELSLSSCTISYCSCLCVSGPLPTPSPWTGSNPRPGTAGGPGPDGALQSGCAGKDCTASLPQWWKDSENRPTVKTTARLKIKMHTSFTGLVWRVWVTNDSCQLLQCLCIPALISASSQQCHHSQLSEETILSLH